MNDRLCRNHAVEQLSARVTSARNDLTISIGRQVIECQGWYRGENGVKASATDAGMSGFAINATFELDPRNDRHQHGAAECGDLVRNRRIAISKMNGYIGVE